MSLGEKIKELLREREWSHYKLAEKTGIPRPTITAIANDKRKASAEVLFKLALAFKMPVEDLYRAAGYDIPTIGAKEEKPEEIAEHLLAITPIYIPVYDTFPFSPGGLIKQIDRIYWSRHRGGKTLEGYIIPNGYPEIHIEAGDIILVDRDAPINDGDMVACLLKDKLCLRKVKRIDDELWLECKGKNIRLANCPVVAKVLEARTRFI